MFWTRSYGDRDPNPETPAFSSTHDWIKYYLAIHQLSGEHSSCIEIATCCSPSSSIGLVTYTTVSLFLGPSYRYAYLLWFVIAALVLLFGAFGRVSGARHSAISALWHKWSIRRPSLFALFQRKAPKLARSSTNAPPPPRKKRTPA